MNILSETQRAYLAGLIDGEGCISISSGTQQAKRGVAFPQFGCKMYISNTNLIILQTVQSWVGEGKITMVRRASSMKEKNWKAVYNWSIYSRIMRQFLPIIFPYLIIKKEQAELALSFLDTVKGRGYGSNLNPEEKRRRFYIVSRLKELNQRGLHASI